MTDIVERLRNPSGDIFPMCREAAAEIERLRLKVPDRDKLLAEIERLRAVNHGNIDFAEQAKAHLNDARNLVATLRAELREAGLLR